MGGANGVSEETAEATGHINEFKKDRAQPSFYAAVKDDMEEKLKRTREAMDALDPHQRILLEGFRPGTYIRLKFKGHCLSSTPTCP